MNNRVLAHGLATSAAFAVLWVGLAFLIPHTTFHLAPPIVATIPPVLAPRTRVLAATGGLALAAAVAVLLSAVGALEGPSLLPRGGALAESLVAALLGPAVALVPRRGAAESDAKELLE